MGAGAGEGCAAAAQSARAQPAPGGVREATPAQVRSTASPLGILSPLTLGEKSRMKKLFIGNLPANATNESVNSLFSEYGKVRSVDVATDIFSGKCRGFGFIEMEGHEARAAMAALDGKSVDGQNLKVREEKPGGRGGRGRRRR